jgi:hypothetical protein
MHHFEKCTRVVSHYVVYERPKDYPNHFVVREWRIHSDGSIEARQSCALAPTLEEARTFIPAWCINIGRQLWDDPSIKEVWI